MYTSCLALSHNILPISLLLQLLCKGRTCCSPFPRLQVAGWWISKYCVKHLPLTGAGQRLKYTKSLSNFTQHGQQIYSVPFAWGKNFPTIAKSCYIFPTTIFGFTRNKYGTPLIVEGSDAWTKQCTHHLDSLHQERLLGVRERQD